MIHFFSLSIKAIESLNDIVTLISNNPYEDIIKPIMDSYRFNDFYIRELVRQLRLSETLIRVIDVGRDTFHAVTHVTIGLIRGLSTMIAKGPDFLEFVIRTGIDKYDVMVGEILNVLVMADKLFSTIFDSLSGYVDEYAGRLEEMVMRKVEDLRRQAISFYFYQIRPNLREFNQLAITLQRQLYRSLQTIFKGSVVHTFTMNLK